MEDFVENLGAEVTKLIIPLCDKTLIVISTLGALERSSATQVTEQSRGAVDFEQGSG
jgi:hypothetical protein